MAVLPRHFAFGDDLALFEPDGSAAGLADLVEIVRHHQHGAGVVADLVDASEAASAELAVAEMLRIR